jgi:hypothetical protein
MDAWKADTARVTWTPSSDEIGAYELAVWADPEGVIDELDEWNNVTDDSTRFYVYFYAEGFPVALGATSGQTVPVSPVTVCDIGGGEGDEIVVAYYNSAVTAVDQFGAELWDFSLSRDVLTARCPAVSDFDLDGTPEIAVVMPAFDGDDDVFVLNSEKDSARVWKQVEIGEAYSAPLVVDVDPVDGRPEVAILDSLSADSFVRLSVWNFAPSAPAESWNEPLGFGAGGRPAAPPTAVNMGLHPADLVTWEYSGRPPRARCLSASGSDQWDFEAPIGSGYRSRSIAAGDLDRDGEVELVSALASPGLLIVHTSDGSPGDTLWTAPVPVASSVVVGNVDSDDALEIVCAGCSSVLVFEDECSYPRLPAWTGSLQGTVVGEPLIGDFDGGDDVEIIVGARDPDGGSLLYIFSVPSTPGALELVVDPVEVAGTYATGALCDLDDDARNDIVFATDNGLLHRFEYWGTSEPRFEWPMYRRDERNSGLYEQPVMGSIVESMTWSGDMFVRGDVVIDSTLTLWMGPGTRVRFAADSDAKQGGRAPGRCELIVDGKLRGVGSENRPIVFQSADDPPLALPDWYGITLERGSVCTLAHAGVSGAKKGSWAIAPDVLDVHDVVFSDISLMAAHLQRCGEGTRLADCRVDADCGVGVRADSCQTLIEGNTITGVREYGLRVHKDEGSTIRLNEITTVGKPLEQSRGIYVAHSIAGLTVVENDIMVEDLNGCGTGVSFYNVPQEPTRVDSNYVVASGASQLSSKGMRLYKTNARLRWNQVRDFTQSFHIEWGTGLVPDLGDTLDTDGNNATDADATYYVYAVAQSPDPPDLMAQMNWWGTDDPPGRKFYSLGGTVVWQPHLETDPFERENGPPDQTDGPASYYLSQNVPNPFNPVTTIRFGLAEAAAVRVTIYDLAGRRVRTLLDAWRPTGHHSVSWDGTSDAGVDVATGVYFYRIEAGPLRETRKAVLLK